MPGIPNERGREGGGAANAPAAQGSFDWNPVDWWNSWFNKVTGWLGGLGGTIASGIESGTIAILKDVWGVVLPFVEIAIGGTLMLIGISLWLASSDAGKAAIGGIAKVGAA